MTIKKLADCKDAIEGEALLAEKADDHFETDFNKPVPEWAQGAISSPQRRTWTFDQGLTTARRLDEALRKVGFFVGLTGSVLRKGVSTKDLDLMVVPLNASDFQIEAARDALRLLGWVQTHSEADLKAIWARKKSTDIKHVEVWATPEGKRVDLMFLK